MKALDKLREISKALTLLGIEYAEKEAELLIIQGLGISTVDLYRDNHELNAEQTAIINNMAARRSKREPLQYITGHTEFSGLKIMVGQGVLIPRPETELMAEYAVKQIRARNTEHRIQSPEHPEKLRNWSGRTQKSERGQRMTILDLCTGSGCLALALAKEFPDTRICGIDISATAIGYAKENSRINNIRNVDFIMGDIFGPLRVNMLFDFIVSNPPYIKTDDIRGLQPEISEWEPYSALDGGGDGLAYYRIIIGAASGHLKVNGTIMLELGTGCADAAVEMCRQAGYVNVEIFKDYAGIERIIQAGWTR
jgi:release factor glutamine methyltransferase